MKKFKKEYYDEFLFSDKDIFGDENEYEYSCYCRDGHAICVPTDGNYDEDGNVLNLPILMMSYPTMGEILKDNDKCDYILEYRGLYDLSKKDLTPADVAMVYGKLFTFNKKEKEFVAKMLG